MSTSCPICGATDRSIAYRGPIRDGSYGKLRDGAVVRRCNGCGVERLDEEFCLRDEAYEGEAYRAHLGQNHNPADHYTSHDELARFTQETLWPFNLRGRTIADVGCGGGSLLDHLKGLPQTALAIDPDRAWAATLTERGYRWFAGSEEAAAEYGGRIDVAFSVQVIEHVSDPKGFLSGIRALMKPDGLLVLATPNRDDIMMDLLPDDFPSFFYRTQHRWYFTAATLGACCTAAGWQVDEIRHVHRYGMANALLWLRDRRPRGRAALPGIDRQADALWKTQLESSGRSDNLYIIARPA